MEFPEDCYLKNVCFENPSMFKEVLMEAYKKTPYNVEKSFIIDAISSPQNKDLTEFFIEEIYKTNNKLMLSSLGNAISRVSSKEHMEKYIKLMYDYKDHLGISHFAGECFYYCADKNILKNILRC